MTPLSGKTSRGVEGTTAGGSNKRIVEHASNLVDIKQAKTDRGGNFKIEDGSTPLRVSVKTLPFKTKIRFSRRWPDPFWLTLRNDSKSRLTRASATADAFRPDAGLLDDIFTLPGKVHDISEKINAVQRFLDRVKRSIQFSADDSLVEAMLSRFESLLLLLIDLSKRDSLQDMIIPVLAYVKTWMGSKSLFGTVTGLVMKILGEGSSGEWEDCTSEGEFVPESGWFQANWTLLTKGKFGKKIAGLITLLVTSGFVSEKQSNGYSEELFRILHIKTMRKENPSILHHLFSTIDFCVDNVIPALTSGDMSLLLTDEDHDEIGKMYRACLDVVHLNISGKMDIALEKYGVEDEAAILVMLFNTNLGVQNMMKRCEGDPAARREYNSWLIKLDKLSTDLQSSWHEAGLRQKPFAVLLRGGSSVGKSTLAGIVRHTICRANGLSERKEHYCTINGNDQYQSDFRSQHVCVLFDDMGNSKPETCEGNPIFILIQFINNMHCSALSPEADKKGKMDIRCRIVIVTTNTDNLHAKYFSINPASVMRRFDVVVDVKLKPGAAAPGGGLHHKFAGNPMPDAWFLNYGTVKISRSDSNSLADDWSIISIGKAEPLAKFIAYLVTETPNFYTTQKEIVDSSSNFVDKEHCQVHPYMTVPCLMCDPDYVAEKKEKVETQAKYPFEVTDWESLKDKTSCAFISEEPIETKLEKLPKVEPPKEDSECKCCGERFCECDYYDDVNKNHSWCQSCHDSLDPHSGLLEGPPPRTGDETIFNWIGATAHNGILPNDTKTFVESFDPLEKRCVLSPRDRIQEILAQGGSTISRAVESVRVTFEDNPLLFVGGIVATIGLGALTMNTFFKKEKMKPEGAIVSKIRELASTPKNIEKRDDVYARPYTLNAVAPEASVTGTLQHIETQIDKNLYIVYSQEVDPVTKEPFGPKKWCNSSPIGGSEWLLPGHQFDLSKTYKVDFQLHPSKGVKRFSVIANDSNLRVVPRTDAVVLDAPSGGDTARFSKYIPETPEFEVKVGDPIAIYHAHKEVLKSPDSYVVPSEYKVVTKVDAVKKIHVKGVGAYVAILYKIDSHEGMCGSMVFTHCRNPVFVGMHSAGSDTKNQGACVALNKKDLFATKNRRKDYINIAESVPLRHEIYGVNTKTTPDVHYKNPVHYLDEETPMSMEIYGENALPRSKFTTAVEESILAEKFCEVSGIDKTHTCPHRKAVLPSRHRHLSTAAEVLSPPDPKLLEMALIDFKTKLRRTIFNPDSNFKEFVHPLDYHDAASGVPGVKGYDPVNPKTAMGFPLPGPKWKYLVENALATELGLQTTRVVKEEVIDGKTIRTYEMIFDEAKADVQGETEEILSVWHSGKRTNICFKTFVKDEAVSFEKVAKNKVRIVSAAPVSMVIACRQLTLPLLNAMSCFPMEFESAVGIDAAGKDWHWIAEQLVKDFGDKLMGAGDYKGFDMRIRAEFSRAAFEILKFCLIECGVDQEICDLIDGLATECMFPIYDIEGLMVKLFGSNPSGHPLTVIINGFVNSLYMRYAYYSMHYTERNGDLKVGDIPLFHHVVALLTYGDDNLFAKSAKERLFNMRSIATELGKIGMVYTDAGKSMDFPETIDFSHLDFLKRDFAHNDIVGAMTGGLSLDSINKSIIMTKKTKGNPSSEAQLAAQIMHGALSEAFLHGEDVYDRYYGWFKQMLDIVDKDGFRVGDFFDPPTIKDLKKRYDSTTCVYDDARRHLNLKDGKEVPLEPEIRGPVQSLDTIHENDDQECDGNDDFVPHSGIVDDDVPDLIDDDVPDLIDDDDMPALVLGPIVGDYGGFDTLVRPEFPRAVFEMLPVLEAMVAHNRFLDELVDFANLRLSVRDAKSQVVQEIRTISITVAQSSNLITHTANVWAVKYFREKRWNSITRNFGRNLPLDVEGRIREFLQPQLVEIANTDYGTYMSTPDFLSDPVLLLACLDCMGLIPQAINP